MTDPTHRVKSRGERLYPPAAPTTLLLASILLVPFTGSCSGPMEGRRPGDSGVETSGLAARSRAEHLLRGTELFRLHCEVCHGERGAGGGEASAYLFPAPRDFSRGRFKLVSTTRGAPLESDLVHTLMRGMPGSAMPSFGWLPEEDLWSLAAFVRQLATEGLAQRLTTEFAHGEGRSPAEARGQAEGIARDRLSAAEAIEVPVRPKATAAVLARGKELFQERCAACHGTDGSGRRDRPRPDEDGQLNWARDFTAGFLQGGASYEDLVHRIVAGMPGTAMPGNDLAPDDLAALALYVRRLIPPGAEDALMQTRGELVAKWVRALPEDPDDAVWDSAPRLIVNLAPLAWSDKSINAVSLSALHDGQRLAVKIAWHDRSDDTGQAFEAGLVDACAVQFSNADAPPLFGMGTALDPTTIWHWKAAWPEDFDDLLRSEVLPHGRAVGRTEGAVLDAPLWRPARAQSSQQAQAYSARGLGNLDQTDLLPRVRSRWSDGSWRVLFSGIPYPSERPLTSGAELNLALAVWNGAAGDHGARKSISIWQQLRIESP